MRLALGDPVAREHEPERQARILAIAPERALDALVGHARAAGDDFYTGVARAGYRGAYLRKLAADVAEGELDVEALADPEVSDDEAAERLLALPGVGPYACAHVMMLLGRYGRLVLDS